METSFPSCSYIANLLLLCFLIFALLLPKSMYTLRAQCNGKDRHLLLQFKHTLVDPSAILSDWTNERDCCEWTGVQCDNTTGRVIELSLPCSTESTPDGCEDEKSHCLTDTVMLHTKGQGLIYQKNYQLKLFEGKISKEIGNLKQLESLDLASNRLSGEIPPSMAQLTFLGTLDLSFNNFSGMIPSGTQLQGFDGQSYIGNPDLCGPPLLKNCTNKEDPEPSEGHKSQDDFFASFYMGLGVGFAIAFWGVCGAIFFNRNFRHSYFRFLHHIRDKIYVIVVLSRMNRFR